MKITKYISIKLIVSIIIGFLVLASYIVYYQLSHTKLTLEIAPGDASVKVDGEVVKKRNLYITTGQHQIIVSRAGFNDKKINLDAKPHQAEIITIALQPNTIETYNWYDKNSADAKIAEKATSQNFDRVHEQMIKEHPIIKLIPYTAYNDALAPKWTLDGQWGNNNNFEYVSLTALSCNDHLTDSFFKEARDYIKNHGIDIGQESVKYFVNCGGIKDYHPENKQ